MMNLIGEKVKHETYGIGVIINADDQSVRNRCITVEFDDGVQKKFNYPEVFARFITAVNGEVQAAIEFEINTDKETATLSKQEEPILTAKRPIKTIHSKAKTDIPQYDFYADNKVPYDPGVISDIPERCIIIKINQQSLDRFDSNKVDAVYEATRWTWKMSLDRAMQAEYVLSVQNGIVIGVFSDLRWRDEPLYKGRIQFDGKRAPEDIAEKYVGKMIPPRYRQKGNASPCQYVNC